MSYTTLANVTGMYPTFAAGSAQQNPPNTLIQTFIDDVGGEIDAVLQRRFQEAIASVYGSFAAFQAALSTDAVNVLEKINRYGAAAQLGQTLATFGIAAAREMAAAFAQEYTRLLRDLEGRAENGQIAAGGAYDFLFDPQARVESPRPGFEGVAGDDQPKNQTPGETGSSAFFGKFDRRGT